MVAMAFTFGAGDATLQCVAKAIAVLPTNASSHIRAARATGTGFKVGSLGEIVL